MNRTKWARRRAVSAVLAGLALVSSARGQPAPASTPAAPELAQQHLRSLAATCAACHGTDGRPIPGSAMPSLRSLSRETFLQRMRAFRDGSQPATVMHQISKGYTPQQIEALAGWFATRP